MIATENINADAISENELIEWSKKDHRYFEPIYEKYYEPIFRLIMCRVQDEEVTKDITSNVFCKALVNLDKYKFQGLSFSSWLYRLALNSCYDYFRTQKKKRTVVLEEFMTQEMAEEFEPETLYLQRGLKLLPEVLDKLKPRDLELIELRFFESKSFKEISEILGITENNAKTRSHRILKRIRKKLEPSRYEI
ncbi:sigma-70 family RNA polymerase sigma factor [uncultured Roseivirga sp.]|uniref:RNA polymerase sigma factor n=1 Tax=uncultured Roseivirga sp. TaxID=543088 RepID=UPI0030D9A98A|tara:strand:- start:59498 stop:60076 length:579 start_codon:yes stop_codon:yes gene_type:complete